MALELAVAAARWSGQDSVRPDSDIGLARAQVKLYFDRVPRQGDIDEEPCGACATGHTTMSMRMTRTQFVSSGANSIEANHRGREKKFAEQGTRAQFI